MADLEVCRIGIVLRVVRRIGVGDAYRIHMRIQYQRAGSRQQGFIEGNDEFRVYLTHGSLTAEVTLSGDDLSKLVGLHLMQAGLVLDIADKIAALPSRTTPSMYPPRWLLGAHKPLRVLSTSPHTGQVHKARDGSDTI